MLVLKSAKEGKAVHSIESYTDADIAPISRKKGGIIHAMLTKRPEYQRHQHFLLPIKNNNGFARIIYKPKLKKSIMQNIRVQRAITI